MEGNRVSSQKEKKVLTLRVQSALSSLGLYTVRKTRNLIIHEKCFMKKSIQRKNSVKSQHLVLLNALILRNFCQKKVTVNFRNFQTVCSGHPIENCWLMPAGFNFYLSLNQQSNVTFPSFYTFIFLLLRSPGPGRPSYLLRALRTMSVRSKMTDVLGKRHLGLKSRKMPYFLVLTILTQWNMTW